MTGETPDKVDVDALIREVRAEATALRRSGVGRSAKASAPGLSALRALVETPEERARSHRRILGPLVVGLKSLLALLSAPMRRRQEAIDSALVEAIEALDHRLEALDVRLSAVEDMVASGGSEVGSLDPGFDYEAFEKRFRGSSEHVEKIETRYLELFADAGAGPVLDLGCGTGGFLGRLRERGIEASGVDRSFEAVERGRAAGLSVECGDLLEALEGHADRSLGGITALQVVEHLSLPSVLRLIRLARRKLRPGGLLVLETVNLASLVVFSRAWTIDPTHRCALHPLTLQFLVEQADFADVRIAYDSPVEPETMLEVPGGDGVADRNVEILNRILFGPQDYAVIARTRA